MKYSVDEVYKLVGRDDRIAVLTLNPPLSKIYGDLITVKFVYSEKERKLLEQNFKLGVDENCNGLVKVQYYGIELSKDLIRQIEFGINTIHIANIFTSNWKVDNSYHSNEVRSVEKLELPFQIAPKGKDYDWIYGFYRKQLREGRGLPPDTMNLYYACKLFYESQNITEEEALLIYESEGVLKPKIEEKLIRIRTEREVELPNDVERFKEVLNIISKRENIIELVSSELQKAGTSVKRLSRENSKLLYEIFMRVSLHEDYQLNFVGRMPIYLNKKGLLHILLRHVKEYQVSNQYLKKDNFQWRSSDLFHVLKAVISDADEEIQNHWVNNPGVRYSKYGEHSYYYQGDYYTFHVEGDGTLSTMHKNRK